MTSHTAVHPFPSRRSAALALCLALAGAAAAQEVHVFPTTPHGANVFPPFDPTTTGTTVLQTHIAHQVFASSLFSNVSAGQTVTIQRIAFSFMRSIETTYAASLAFRFGYTNAIPNAAAGSGGLEIPSSSGGGLPNAFGPMTDFYVNPTYSITFPPSAGSEAFAWGFDGTPFEYDPALGNLLMEIVVIVDRSLSPMRVTTSQASPSTESSMALYSTNWTSTAPSTRTIRTQFTFTVGGMQTCWANCDDSTTQPILNVADFGCFLSKFAAGDSYANCDGSTTEPILNVADFGCFLSKFAAGCR